MIPRLLPLLIVLLLCTCDRGPTELAERAPERRSTAADETGLTGAVTIRSGEHRVTFAPAEGGRLASYTVGGTELLKTTRDENGWQWGSTVWTSPQSAWNWPPEKTFDAQPFTVVEQARDAVKLLSAVDPETGLQLEKLFTFIEGPKGRYLQADYLLTNHGPDTLRRGLWENTRLPYAGEFYFSADSLRREGLERAFAERGATTLVAMNEADTEKGKLFIHPAKGRATYAGGGLRFRKLWIPVTEEVAPGQAPLEIYLAPKEGFAEFEVQGGYRTLPPGGSTTLNVAWRVGKLVAVD